MEPTEAGRIGTMGARPSRPSAPQVYRAFAADSSAPLRVDLALYGELPAHANVTAAALRAHAGGAPFTSPAPDLFLWRVATPAGDIAREGPLAAIPPALSSDPHLPLLLVLRGVRPERVADVTAHVVRAVLRGAPTLDIVNGSFGGTDPHYGFGKQLLLCATPRGSHAPVVVGPVQEYSTLPLQRPPFVVQALVGSFGAEDGGAADAEARAFLRDRWSFRSEAQPPAGGEEGGAAGAASAGGSSSSSSTAEEGAGVMGSIKAPRAVEEAAVECAGGGTHWGAGALLPASPNPAAEGGSASLGGESGGGGGAAAAAAAAASTASAAAADTDIAAWVSPPPSAPRLTLGSAPHQALPLALARTFGLVEKIRGIGIEWAVKRLVPDVPRYVADDMVAPLSLEASVGVNRAGRPVAVRIRVGGREPEVTVQL